MRDAEPKATPTTPLLSVEAAVAAALAVVRPVAEVDRVALPDAVGRVLARAAHADMDQPAFDRAMMDGVAVRSADADRPGVRLRVVGAAPAGAPYAGTVGPGEAVRVMTGGVVPAGADAVLQVELLRHVDGDPAGGPGATVELQEAVAAERNVARVGSEVRRGDVVVPAGVRVGGARLGALAAFGHTRLEVYRRPRVGLLPTGDEVVRVDATPAIGQVRDSNRWALAASLAAFGAEVLHGEIARDEPEAIARSIERLLPLSDLLVLSGGVSMGDYDLVASTLKALGAELVFHRVRMRPGKPVLLATLRGTPILGLPGNPVSSVVGAHLFARPMIARLAGLQHGAWVRAQVAAAHAFPANGGREAMVAARWRVHDGIATVEASPTAGSADLAHWSASSLLVRRPVDAPAVADGGMVDVLFWNEP